MAVFEGGDPHVGVRARERIERVLGTLEGSSHAAGLEAALYTLAWLDFSRGHLRDADARMPRVLELRRALGRPTTAYIPSSLLDGPTPLEERTLAALRSDAAEAAGSVFAERNGQLAGLYAIAGHPQIADAILGQALDVAVALALPSTIGSVELDAGLLCLRTGQIEGATRHFAASEHAFRGSGEGSFRATALGHLARALALAGDVEGAHRAVTQARGLMDEDDLLTVIAADSAEGLARATMGDPEGIQLAIRAIRRARDTEFLVARCDALVDLAHACVQLGEIDAAAAAASEAIEGFDQKLARGAVSAIRKGFAAAFDRSPTRTGSSDDPAE
jgi:tetratricopeptide (TPR) repeat protein